MKLTFAVCTAVLAVTASSAFSQTTNTVTNTTTTAFIDTLTTLGQRALEESATPVRPGKPGERPFWNGHSKRFIYAPAFDYKKLDNASKYRYDIVSEASPTTFTFESAEPYAALSPVWTKVPVGFFTLKVTGLSDDGTSVGVAGEGKYYRAAPFNGPYHVPPAMPLDKSATLALDNLLKKDYVEHWLTHKTPDPSYNLYRYPSKIFGALVIGAITQARLTTGTEEAKRSMDLAVIIADYMLSIRFAEGTPWEFQVPTYYGPHMARHLKGSKTHMRVENHMTIMGVDAGNAFLDLYDVTKDDKYLQAARHIAETYLKTQTDDGSWPLLVNHHTGKTISELVTIPTAIINYYDRLRRDYQVTDLEGSGRRALEWTMANPVKTFEWHGQFEDIKPTKPYVNQSREQACDLAIYLFKNNRDLELAKELVRYAEDQFVIWEQPMPRLNLKPNAKGKGFDPATWITPSVQEQYVFWTPVGRTAGIMVDTYWEAYVATKDEMYLAKAQSIAGSWPEVQKHHNGDYPTFFTPHKLNFWLNSVVYPAKVLMNLKKNLDELEKI